MEDDAPTTEVAEPVVTEATPAEEEPVAAAPAEEAAPAAQEEHAAPEESKEAESKEEEAKPEADSKEESAQEAPAAKHDEDEAKEAEPVGESVQDKVEGMSALVKERPPNPIEWLAAYLLKNNPQGSSGGEAK